MKLQILNEHGDILSEVQNVTISPAGSQNVRTKHGVFDVVEVTIDYANDVIIMYSDLYTIDSKYEEEYNEFGVYLESNV